MGGTTGNPAGEASLSPLAWHKCGCSEIHASSDTTSPGHPERQRPYLQGWPTAKHPCRRDRTKWSLWLTEATAQWEKGRKSCPGLPLSDQGPDNPTTQDQPLQREQSQVHHGGARTDSRARLPRVKFFVVKWSNVLIHLFFFARLRDRHTQRDPSFDGSLPTCPQQPGPDQAEARSLERNPGLPHRWQRPKRLSHRPLPPR